MKRTISIARIMALDDDFIVQFATQLRGDEATIYPYCKVTHTAVLYTNLFPILIAVYLLKVGRAETYRA